MTNQPQPGDPCWSWDTYMDERIPRTGEVVRFFPGGLTHWRGEDGSDWYWSNCDWREGLGWSKAAGGGIWTMIYGDPPGWVKPALKATRILVLARIRPGLSQDGLSDMALGLNLRYRLRDPLPVVTVPGEPPSHRIIRAWVEDDQLLAEAEEVMG